MKLVATTLPVSLVLINSASTAGYRQPTEEGKTSFHMQHTGEKAVRTACRKVPEPGDMNFPRPVGSASGRMTRSKPCDFKGEA